MADEKLKFLVKQSFKEWFLAHPLVDAVRWWFSKRKIRKYASLLDPAITRRSFFSIPLLLLAPGHQGQLPSPIPEIKQQLISEYIKTKAGRMKLAAAMIQPLRTGRDYATIGRKVFQVQQLPARTLPFYDGDLSIAEHLKEPLAVNGD